MNHSPALRAVPPAPAAAAPVDQAALRRAAGRYVTGVGVVTAPADDGTPTGATVNAITCLSLEPPLYLACLSNTSNTLQAIRQTGVFGIHILADGQHRHAMTFASKAADKFAGLAHETGRLGVPLLCDAVARFECEVEHLYAGGDHTIVVGRVHGIHESDDVPLVMRSGKFVELAAAAPALQVA